MILYIALSFFYHIPIMIPATSTSMLPQPTPTIVAPPVFNELTLSPVAALAGGLVCVLALDFVPLSTEVLASVLVEAPVLVAEDPVSLCDEGDAVLVLGEEMAKRPE